MFYVTLAKYIKFADKLYPKNKKKFGGAVASNAFLARAASFKLFESKQKI